MNYITNDTESQSLDLTVNYSFSENESIDVAVVLSQDGNHSDTQEVSGTVVFNGYYSTLTLSGLSVDLETNYLMEIKKDSKTIYKGKAFVTSQTIGEYEINNDNYIKQATTTNDFIIFD